MRPRPRPRVLGRAVAAAVFLVGSWCSVQAQESHPPGSPAVEAPAETDSEIPGTLGLDLSVAIPQGEFGRNIGAGLGLTGHLSFRFLRVGWLGLRVDGGMIWYGYETDRERLYVRDVPIDVDVTTTNTILQAGIGPQFHATGYPLNADVYVLAGFSRFATTSSVSLDPRYDDEPDIDLGSATHLSDWSPSITLGGELNWTIAGDREGYLGGIALGLEYRRHGKTRYLREGSIREVNGHAVFEPFETRADFWVIRIGVWGGTW